MKETTVIVIAGKFDVERCVAVQWLDGGLQLGLDVLLAGAVGDAGVVVRLVVLHLLAVVICESLFLDVEVVVVSCRYLAVAIGIWSAGLATHCCRFYVVLLVGR